MREQDIIIELPPHRLLGCDWDPELENGVEASEEVHILTAGDFVVDEFELYGCGD